MKLKVEEKKESSSMRFTLKLDQELRSCFPAWGKGSLRGTSQGASILLIFRRPSLQAVPSPSLMVPLSSWWHVFFGCTEPQGWTKLQKPAKNKILKIREIDGSYLHLQRFDKFWV